MLHAYSAFFKLQKSGHTKNIFIQPHFYYLADHTFLAPARECAKCPDSSRGSIHKQAQYIHTTAI